MTSVIIPEQNYLVCDGCEKTNKGLDPDAVSIAARIEVHKYEQAFRGHDSVVNYSTAETHFCDSCFEDLKIYLRGHIKPDLFGEES